MDSEPDWTGPVSGALARLPVGRAGPGRAVPPQWQGGRDDGMGRGAALPGPVAAWPAAIMMMMMTGNSAAAGAGRGPRCAGTQAATLAGLGCAAHLRKLEARRLALLSPPAPAASAGCNDDALQVGHAGLLF